MKSTGNSRKPKRKKKPLKSSSVKRKTPRKPRKKAKQAKQAKPRKRQAKQAKQAKQASKKPRKKVLRDKRGRFRSKPARDALGRFTKAAEKAAATVSDAEKAAEKIVADAKAEAEKIRAEAIAEVQRKYMTDAEAAANWVHDFFKNLDTSRTEQADALLKLHVEHGIRPTHIAPDGDEMWRFLETVMDELTPSEIYSTLLGSPPDDIGVDAA